MPDPRMTFGMIVLNGEPFVRYNLRALYPYAHQIVIVEGAAPNAASISSPDGHSTDTTLATVRDFMSTEDPEHKVTLVTAEDEGHADGFWPGEKDEMSQAYARRATGDYLWQVDVDEFYTDEGIAAVMTMLRDDPSITAVSFWQTTFWGGLDYVTDGWYLRWGAGVFHRLFKWGPGYRYTTHRPPTVVDDQGRDLRSLRWEDGDAMARRGVRMYHYSLLFPRQVAEKAAYYAAGPWGAYSQGVLDWAQSNYALVRRPFRIHNVHTHPSWLCRFVGDHPAHVQQMWQDAVAGCIGVQVRRHDDVDALLSCRLYGLGRWVLHMLSGISARRWFPKRVVYWLLARIAFDPDLGRMVVQRRKV